jgi:hypothetical protein
MGKYHAPPVGRASESERGLQNSPEWAGLDADPDPAAPADASFFFMEILFSFAVVVSLVDLYARGTDSIRGVGIVFS